MDARTEAAAKFHYDDARNPGITKTWSELSAASRAVKIGRMRKAFAAADAVEAPLAEQLATALRDLATDVRRDFFSRRVAGDLASADHALAVFDAARADSQGTATKEET